MYNSRTQNLELYSLVKTEVFRPLKKKSYISEECDSIIQICRVIYFFYFIKIFIILLMICVRS